VVTGHNCPILSLVVISCLFIVQAGVVLVQIRADSAPTGILTRADPGSFEKIFLFTHK
jgi:hypothetical protein